MTDNPILPSSQWILEILSWVLLILSLIFCFRKSAPQYLKTFPIYCAGNCLPALLTEMWSFNTAIAVLLFSIFELGYFTYFFSKVIASRRAVNVLWGLTGLVIGFALFRKIGQPARKINLTFVLLECFILSIVALYYLMEILRVPQYVDVSQVPAFWMTWGILFYFVLSIPIVICTTYLYSIKNKYWGDAVYSLNQWFQIVSYILYFKAMICHLPKRSSPLS